jgi:hypothetical protein
MDKLTESARVIARHSINHLVPAAVSAGTADGKFVSGNIAHLTTSIKHLRR